MNQIFSNTEIYLLIAIAVLLVFVIVLAVLVAGLNRKVHTLDARLGRFMKGPDGASLEDAIIKMFEEHDLLMKDMQQDRKDIDDLYEKIRPMIQKVGVVKYDAFQQMGGNLSSAIVMLNEENNGFIINTVQSADGCYSYVKEISEGHPDIELGKEEQEAYDKAMQFGKTDTSYVDAVHAKDESRKPAPKRPAGKSAPQARKR